MSFNQRLKNSRWLNWKFPVIYFIVSAIVFLFFLFISEGHRKLQAVYITLPLFTFVLYFVHIARDMISDNFIIKNHRHTPLLMSFVFAVAGIITFSFRGIIWKNMGMALIYVAAMLFAIAITYHIFKYRRSALNLMSLGVIVFLFSLVQYLIIAFLLLNYTNISLVILGMGALFGSAIFATGVVVRLRYSNPIATLSSLNIRFENYLDSVFNGLPMVDELIVLREQLKASLTHYAEQNFASNALEQKIYANALNSLGNFAPILYPYRKNIAAQLSGSKNKTANLWISLIMQAGFTYLYFWWLNEERWVGLWLWIYEVLPLLIILVFISFIPLVFTRLITNIKTKKHQTTPLAIGSAIFIILTIASIVAGLAIYDDFVIPTGFAYALGGVFAVTFAMETVLFSRRKKHEKIYRQQ